MLNKILSLFYRQEIFKDLPRPQTEAYFRSIIKDGQIVTIERDGRLVAFQDYWIINRKVRDLLLKMTGIQMEFVGLTGSYPHYPNGKHLYLNYTVIDQDFKNQFLTFELAKKINEKNPQMQSLAYHRLDGRSYLQYRRGK